MKRSIKMGLVCLLAGLFLLFSLGCGQNRAAEAEGSGEASQKAQTAEPQRKALPTVEEQAEQILASMTEKEKVGQLIMMSLPGTEVDDEARFALQQFHYGGIVLFDRNFASKEQVRNFVMDAQAGCGAKVPLFVAIDEEGGLVARGKDVIPAPPSAQAVGQESREFAKKLAVAVAGDLKSIGVNVNFAPVVDLGLGRERSYSESPYEVLKFAQAVTEGYKEGGIICTLKHFPGIGKGTVDSHQELSSIDATEHQLRSQDLVPFREILNGTEQGRGFDYMIMVGHFLYPAFDSERPASLSKTIITGLLRENLGYQGLIITDDLGMGAIIKTYSFGGAAAEAIKAGADIALVCHDYGHAEEAYMGIYQAVERGEISQKRLDESVRRILLAKLSHGLRP